MKKSGYPPVKFSAALLSITLLWSLLGAPINLSEFRALQTPMWQARILLPSRINRICSLWMPVQLTSAGAETMLEELESETEEKLNLSRECLYVYLTSESRIVEMSLDGYVCGVVAAEMPAAWHIEALKAQAVAARTRAVSQKANGGCALHSGADICTDSGHCQAYATPEDCRKLWGGAYEAYRGRILSAARDTAGELIYYGDELITVLYHAMSGGQTEAAQTVFSQALPYLVSVSSTGEENSKGFYTDTTLTYSDIASKLNIACPGLNVDADGIRQTLTIVSHTPTGRVNEVLACGQRISGVDFRHALALRSTWFTFSTDSDGVTFHQRGYGHGVGMSQTGASHMAADGADYQEILTHYYQGTQVKKAHDGYASSR